MANSNEFVFSTKEEKIEQFKTTKKEQSNLVKEVEIEEAQIAKKTVENKTGIKEQKKENIKEVKKESTGEKKHYKVFAKLDNRRVIVDRGDGLYITLIGNFENLNRGDEFDY